MNTINSFNAITRPLLLLALLNICSLPEQAKGEEGAESKTTTAIAMSLGVGNQTLPHSVREKLFHKQNLPFAQTDFNLLGKRFGGAILVGSINSERYDGNKSNPATIHSSIKGNYGGLNGFYQGRPFHKNRGYLGRLLTRGALGARFTQLEVKVQDGFSRHQEKIAVPGGDLLCGVIFPVLGDTLELFGFYEVNAQQLKLEKFNVDGLSVNQILRGGLTYVFSN